MMKCFCGKPAVSRCGEGVPGLQLILCREPVCGENGQWCGTHRHKKGTMGFPDWNPVAISYNGYLADAPGIWPAVTARLKTLFLTASRIAQMARDEQLSQFQPNAPVPDLTFYVGRRVFQSDGNRMIETTP